MSGWSVFFLVVTAIACVLLVLVARLQLRIVRQHALTKQLFARYGSPDRIEGLVQALTKHPPAPEPRTVSFAVLQVRDDDIESVQGRLAQALAIVEESGAMVECLAASLVIATFGTFPRGVAVGAKDNCDVLAGRLVSELGQEVRLVHGTAPGLVGNFGSAKRMSYGSVLPNFGRVLEKLAQLEFGQAAEVSLERN